MIDGAHSTRSFRRRRAAVGALALALAASGVLFVSTSSGSTPSGVAFPTLPKPGPGQQAQLVRACRATAASIRRALNELPKPQVQSIQSHLQVVTPGTLNGKLAFNRTGSSINLSGDRSPDGMAASASFGCAQAAAGGGRGSGKSHVVAILKHKFSRPGRYELTFNLNQTGRKMLSQLAAAVRSYRLHNPQGGRPPTLAFGVSLTYATG
jgi:hypothetical protein